MTSSARTAETSTGEAPAYPIIVPRPTRRQPPTRDDWRAYERHKRRLAAIHGDDTEAYDTALRDYLEGRDL